MVETLRLKLKEQKGFTLIELLAVIVILGIIAAIAIPAISNVISKSDVKADAQSGLQIINAAKLYVAEHPEAKSGDVLDTELEQYLDSVTDSNGDPATGWEVTISTTTSGGKFIYTLTDFSVGGVSTNTEATLIKKAK